MRKCNHSHWLALSSRNDEIIFQVSNRATNLLQSLPHLQVQTPTLFVFVGNKSKILALQELTSSNINKRNRGKRSNGEIHLHIDASSVLSDRPILIADSDFPSDKRSVAPLLAGDCHEVISTVLPKPRSGVCRASTMLKAADNLHLKFLSPFVDVFCFFAADLGGLQPIAQRLASWLKNDQPSTLPAATHAHIIIVVESSALEFRILEEFFDLFHNETEKNLFTHFGNVRIITLLPQSSVSPETQHKRLKEYLIKASDKVRLARIKSNVLFSGQHFLAFLNQASSQFGAGSKTPFDFIQESRINNQVAPDLKDHLVNFLSLFKDNKQLQKLAVPLITSSLMLDHYPPDMHLFDPCDVFRVLYKEICYQAYVEWMDSSNMSDLLLPSGFLKMIEKLLQSFFAKLQRSAINIAVDSHRQVLLRTVSNCLSIRLDNTCVICIRRTPQYGLPCGHVICENCVRVFGRLSPIDPWLFEVDSCFFCGLSTSGVVVRTLPPTAGIRVLTFDGGGIRGVASLQYLQVLQERIGLPYPVQENFDMVYGTSIGAIVALKLCVMGWSIEKCIERAEHFAKFAFQPRLVSRIPAFIPKIPGLSAFVSFLISYFADGCYSADYLEEILQEEFGKERSILDCSNATATGTRIGIPVTTIQDATTCIFTNYNAVGTRPLKCGYHALRPKCGLGQVPLWKIARCGSAAPWYFKPKHIPGIGTFQDGGVRQNDPGNIALQEVAVTFPNSVEPSLVVSLGTGATRVNEVPEMGPSRGLLKDGFIPRLIRAFKLSFGSTIAHKHRSLRKQGHREQYFRFDIEFDHPEPELDDTTRMQEVKERARSAICGSKDIDQLARCVIAELFLFELDSVPKKERGRYICQGRIICRLRAHSTALQVLLEQLNRSSAVFLVQGHHLKDSLDDGSYEDKDGNFGKTVSFEVFDKSTTFSIQLKEGSSQPCGISGSPFSIDSLVAAQQLECPFGTMDHIKRKRVNSIDLSSRKRPRRLV
ncbi:similar to patatin-like phospholipase [Botrytis cinerea T4]|uniref:Similar to patatin-like phospholipase n=1 Tax=Botryotinia fuckeliana (strain T4) TaxID=999810 RepID=G2XP55_BOTF4|nr:similar to patatin-like phospholipase [Botrytis cinerea T4]